MKTYLCDKIDRINISRVKSLTDGLFVFTNPTLNLEPIPDVISGIYTEETHKNAAGTIYIQKLTISANVPDSILVDYNDQPQIFKLRFSDGSENIWGTINNPVLCTGIRADKNQCQITFERRDTVNGF